MVGGAATPEGFVGLNADRPDKALLNGQQGSLWFYAVGQVGAFALPDMPGPLESATKMELYVKMAWF